MMKIFTHLAMAVIFLNLLMPSHARAQDIQEQPSAVDALQSFDRLIGGQWHFEGSYQEFEWGVGKRSVKSRSYFVVEGKPRLVSEGVWFWHPGEKQIKGIFTAIDMPVTFFDYTTRFEGTKMLNDLRSYGPNNSESQYLETWDFRDDNHYVWTLLRKSSAGLKKEMAGTYQRK